MVLEHRSYLAPCSFGVMVFSSHRDPAIVQSMGPFFDCIVNNKVAMDTWSAHLPLQQGFTEQTVGIHCN